MAISSALDVHIRWLFEELKKEVEIRKKEIEKIKNKLVEKGLVRKEEIENEDTY